MPYHKIDTRAELSAAEFQRDYLLRGTPVVLKGAVTHWPACRKWTPEYLRAVAGHEPVWVLGKADYSGGQSTRQREARARATAAEAIDLATSDEPPGLSYMRQSDLIVRSASLSADISTPDYIPPWRTATHGPALWLGPKGTVAQLHWDPAHNFFTQVSGRKHVVVLPPWEARCGYPNRFGLASVLRRQPRALLRPLKLLAAVNNSHVDAGHPDLRKHSRWSQAHPLECVLEPGDALFIPDMWRHYVRSLDISISVNWFFELPLSVRARLHRLRTIGQHIGLSGDDDGGMTGTH